MIWKRLLRFWDREESLTTFLWLLILFIFVIVPASQLDDRFRIVVEIFFGLVLISGIWATLGSPRLVALVSVFVVIAIGAFIAKIILNSNVTALIISECCLVPAIGLLLFVVIKQTMKDGPVTSHRVKGAVATYLLLGMLWAKLYEIIALAVPNSFNGISSADPGLSFIYFSFVTLTTVGYGDIAPTFAFARSLANAEALIGQLFPAIFIARLVSLQVENRRG